MSVSFNGNTVNKIYIDQGNGPELLRKMYLSDGSGSVQYYDLPIPINYTCGKSIGTLITGNDKWALKLISSSNTKTLTPGTANTQQDTWYAYPGMTLSAAARESGVDTNPMVTLNGTKVQGNGKYTLNITNNMASISVSVNIYTTTVLGVPSGEYWQIAIKTTNI